MVGGDAVAEHGQHARSLDVLDGGRFERHVVEVRRLPDVGGIFSPRVSLTLRNRQPAPALVSRINLGVALAEHLRCNRTRHRLLDFPLRRPNVGQVNGFAILAFSERILAQVDIDAASQRKGHHQRRRHQVVGAYLRIDPAFKVAIAGEHRSNDQILLFNFSRHLRGQRARVSDARRAAVADEVELQFLQKRHQAGLLQIVEENFRSGSERSLDRCGDLKAALHGFFRQQSSRDQHRGVRRVRTTRDRRNDHAAVL